MLTFPVIPNLIGGTLRVSTNFVYCNFTHTHQYAVSQSEDNGTVLGSCQHLQSVVLSDGAIRQYTVRLRDVWKYTTLTVVVLFCTGLSY